MGSDADRPVQGHRGLMERSADWMDQARGDLDHARSDVQGGFYEWACLSAQQAAAKAVKAVFQKLGREAWATRWPGC